ncbi:MAG: hypothetical protein ACK58T_26900 [Phycisphaerae bacterium]
MAGNRAAKGHLLDIDGLRGSGCECERRDGGGRDDVKQDALETGEGEKGGEADPAAFEENGGTHAREACWEPRVHRAPAGRGGLVGGRLGRIVEGGEGHGHLRKFIENESQQDDWGRKADRQACASSGRGMSSEQGFLRGGACTPLGVRCDCYARP